MLEFDRRGLSIQIAGALLDGQPVASDRVGITVADDADSIRVSAKLNGASASIDSLGVRLVVKGANGYLRNGYHSWDGSWLEKPGARHDDEPTGKARDLGFAMTALTGRDGAALLGFERHDRFQTRFRFSGDADEMIIDAETLLDRTGATAGETLLLFDGDDLSQVRQRWARMVARASPLPPRTPRRITGWCSWYNHYAMIDELTIQREIESCAAFRDAHKAPLDIFLIDDGFTPEMGDWLDTKPQFPRGMAPLLREIDAAGFTPGLWIAPFIVGNRSRLFRDHPDWVAYDHSGAPLRAMHFYGEFRWHKRSEEYYVLDVTHPEAASYIGSVFRVWARDWGARYFKTDFMYYPMEHGPESAVWHEPGLSRVAIWRRMAQIIRDNIGDALWLGCGCPLWASIGYVDAVRIGRDVGVELNGEYSAKMMANDLAHRAPFNSILWQADPDCLLLRERFHELTPAQIEQRARAAAACGGVLMTSDTLAELPLERAALFAALLS